MTRAPLLSAALSDIPRTCGNPCELSSCSPTDKAATAWPPEVACHGAWRGVDHGSPLPSAGSQEERGGETPSPREGGGKTEITRIPTSVKLLRLVSFSVGPKL